MIGLRDLENALPLWQCVHQQPLSGGLTNRCVKITWRCRQSKEIKHTVWRPTSEATLALGIDRRTEWAILSQLSTISPLVPKPWCLIEQGVLVEWLEGTTPLELSMSSLLSLLVSVHQLPCPDNAFSLMNHLDRYWQQLPKTAAFESLRLQRFSLPSWEGHSQPSVCCHYDIGAHNVVESKNGLLKIIDWEYAAAGDPAFELALMIVAHDWSVSDAVTQYCLLSNISDVNAWYLSVKCFMPWAEYISKLWFAIMETEFTSQ
jgi:thiamine kinase